MSSTQEIRTAVQKALTKLHIDSPLTQIEVGECGNAAFGDYTCNIALQLFDSVDKKQWNSPRALAQGIADVLQVKEMSIAVAGAGFLNFTLSNTLLSQQLREILEKKNVVKNNKSKKAIVEYSSPNIAKPFTIGHLRTTVIGDAVANLLEATGWTIYRDNHLGDWGTQFGKLIVAIKRWGDLDAIESSETPVKELVSLYVKFHDEAKNEPSLEDEGRAWFTKLEHGDPEARALWQKCIDWSWKEFDRVYKELGIAFTENGGLGYGESFFEDKMGPIVKILEKSGYMKDGKEGAKLFFFPDDEFPPLMILKKDGSTLYATRDLATDFFRLHTPKYGKDITIINEVGGEQALYFKQIYRIEELIGWVKPGQRIHVKHGLYRFKEGKMSTRKGNVIWLADVITEAKQRALTLKSADHKTDPKTAHQIAIGALKWNDLKRSCLLDVTFDWDEILSMEGNSGPYMQYTAVRAKSVLEKGKGSLLDAETTLTFEASERLLARQLVYFQAALERAAKELTPHLLCTYLYTLASMFNSFYNSSRILGEKEHEKKRLMLTQATYDILEQGLNVIGIQIPENM